MSPSSSCQQCARLLKKVLSENDSRPMTILEALGSSNETMKTEDGDESKTSVRLQVPRNTSVAANKTIQWDELHKKQNNPTTDHHQQQQQLATSVKLITKDQEEEEEAVKLETLKIECRPCADTGPERGARAFVMGPTPLSIVLCSNRLSLDSKDEMEQVLVHELMHVYDVRVNQLDLRTCENLAYSEVRAAREAECQKSWLAGQYCVPQKAYRAIANLFPAHEAKACLNRVFSTAMNDMAPLCSNSTTTVRNSETLNRKETPLKSRETVHLRGKQSTSNR